MQPHIEGEPRQVVLLSRRSPFGLLVDWSGGKISDGITGGPILYVRINGVDQRTALYIGATNKVDRFNEHIVNVVNGDAKED